MTPDRLARWVADRSRFLKVLALAESDMDGAARSGHSDGPPIWGIPQMDDKRSVPAMCIWTEHLR
jgi:hypothetical protein